MQSQLAVLSVQPFQFNNCSKEGRCGKVKMTAFEEMGVMPEIAKAVDEMEWSLPTDVQAEAIPLILGGGDVLMAAETGSGKTGAFCLPILQIVHETVQDLSQGRSSKVIIKASEKWALSVFDRDSALAVTADGLTCQARHIKEWHGSRATKGVKGKGKYMYEATVADEGLCRVGWSTLQANLDLGTDKYGFGYGGTGKKSNNKQFDNYGEPFGLHDVIGCCINLDDSEIKFVKNGQDFGVAFKIPNFTKEGPFFPAVVLKNGEITFNFGDEPFKFPQRDYVPVSKATERNIADNFNGTPAQVVAKRTNNAPQALIIEPSRELAEQTYNQLLKFKAHLTEAISILLAVGGVSSKEQVAMLNSGVDIVVGTPGRLEELITVGHMSLSQCRFFVLDEADGLLKQGYGGLIEKVHTQIPKFTSDGKRLQMIVCSATLHDFDVKRMADKLMNFPTWVDLKGEDAVPETVHHVVVMVDPQKDKSWQTLRTHIPTDGVHARDNVTPGNNKPETLSEATKILKGEYCVRAIKEHKMDRCIIFCRTKLDCDNLERYFNQIGGGPKNPNNPYSCVCLHSDRKPPERKANLEKFKNREVKFLICTDVAARGIDVSGLPFMINVTLPDEKSNYVHRIGRVGRAERMGLAISLVSTVPEKVWYHGQWCSSRGQNCHNTNLTDARGCCIWYNEKNCLAEIEDHLNVTIQQVEPDIKVPINEFDGKVTYGEKRAENATEYEYQNTKLADTIKGLGDLESKAQIMFIKRHLKSYFN